MLADCAPEERAALLQIWSTVGVARPTVYADVERKEAARAAMLALVDQEATLQPATRLVRPVWWQRVYAFRYAWAGSFAVLLVLVYALAFHQIRVTVPHGATPVTMSLPDGSSVELNAGATLSYTRTYGWQARNVVLEGEGFFSVVPSEQTFSVRTHDATTTVLGTSFNVRAYENRRAGATRVTVATGKVHVATFDSGAAVEVTPGQIAQVTPSASLTTDTEHATEQTAWREGRLAFYNEPLGHIFAELERRYGVTITVDPDITARRWVYAKDNPADLKTVLDDITQSVFLTYYPTSNGYQVLPAN